LSLTLREEYRLKVFKYRVLRRLYGPKGEEAKDEEVHNLYSSPHVIRVVK
jgi:hypothetical protein